MTRKHFILIAKAIKYNSIYTKSGIIIKKNALVDDLCHIFKLDNNNFNDDKFRNACNK